MNSPTRRLTLTMFACAAACGLAATGAGIASADVQYGPTFTGDNAARTCQADVANEEQYAAPGYTVHCEAVAGGGQRITIMTMDELVPQTLIGIAAGSSGPSFAPR